MLSFTTTTLWPAARRSSDVLTRSIAAEIFTVTDDTGLRSVTINRPCERRTSFAFAPEIRTYRATFPLPTKLTPAGAEIARTRTFEAASDTCTLSDGFG